MENRGTRKHVSGEEQKRSANYSSLTKPEGDKQQSSNPPLFRKPLGLCPPLCFFIVQNNTNNHLLQSSRFFFLPAIIFRTLFAANYHSFRDLTNVTGEEVLQGDERRGRDSKKRAGEGVFAV